jgi:N-acetylmuramic acid 6-phosphate etherase
MLLNSHSTLVMGRLGRFEGNIMTWVRPTCNKLIDRAIRYAGHLLRKNGIEKTYKEIAYACFELMERVPADQPLVYAILEKFAAAHCDRNTGPA